MMRIVRRLFPPLQWTLLITVLLTGAPLQAQDPPRRWERRLGATEAPLTVFHSTQAINLPTAVTLRRGEWQFEIAHRFFPPVTEGHEALWGLDGPAFMRIGLGYAVTDRLLLTAARSNLQDNWDLQGKLQVLAPPEGGLPLQVALQGGVAWSTDVAGRDSGDRGNVQYYAQLILNSRVGDRLALGLVPSWLYNVRLDREDPVQDLYWGAYGQLYLTEVLSTVAEWNVGKDRGELTHDAGSFGIELETGGHFFKIFLTNSVRLNPSQFLAGSSFPFAPNQWRLGFVITRLLRF